MKPNDWIAVNLNLQDTNVSPDSLRVYNISPDNTGLQDKDYYKSIQQVKDAFTKDDKFDEDAFSSFYDSAKRSYSRFAQDDYVDNIISSIPSSAEDIFSIGDYNIQNDTAYMRRSRDPERHQIGIGNLFRTGEASFTEREVAQENKVLDENGNVLDWSPNDKGGIFKALFRPTLALATWKEGEKSIENGVEVTHHAGERKYDEFGDPMYQVIKKDEIYGKEILHWGDTVTREGTFLNKIDPWDSDSVKKSAGRVLYSTFVGLIPYLTPAGEIFGAFEATKAIFKTLPVVTKAINGVITGDNSNGIGRIATSLENYMSRFNQSTSDYGQKKGFWSWESIGNQIVDSASQLYSQGLIQKLPFILHKHPSLNQVRLGQIMSTAYLASTNSEDVYAAYREAGVNERFAGIGALATMGAFAAFMSNEYFKEFLFNDPALESPELKRALRYEFKNAAKTLVERIKTNEGLNAVTTVATETAEEAAKKAAKWYNKAWKASLGALKKAGKAVFNPDNRYLVRAFNEGIEEVMEEGATDLIKGMTLGFQDLGINVKDKNADRVDFGFSPEDFISRYSSSFIGGALGGAVFEGLQRYQNKVIHRGTRYVSDLDQDEQLMWYIRNGHTKELLAIVDNWEKRGKLGSKNISYAYTVNEDESGNKSIVWNPAGDTNQNSEIANALRQKIRTLAMELQGLDFLHTDNEILEKAMTKIEEEARAAGMEVSEYQDKKLRDARIDFIKQRRVDKLIVLEAADLQHDQLELTRRIKEHTDEIMNVPDTERHAAEERVNNDALLKQYNKDLEEAKKAYKDLMRGKRTNEYLALGLFSGDDQLVNLYLGEKGEDAEESYYVRDVKNFVRAKYGQNMDEMLRKAGDGAEALRDYLQDQFDTWQNTFNGEDDIFKIRGAYDLHKRLSERLRPVIEEQMRNYSEYEVDSKRSSVIRALDDSVDLDNLITDTDTLGINITELLNTTHQHLLAGFTGNPEDIDEVLSYIGTTGDAEFDNKVKKFTQNKVKIGLYSNPARYLDQLFQNPSSNALQELMTTVAEDGDVFTFLKNYYQSLNDDKLVSEFADDLLEIGAGEIAKRLRPGLNDRLEQLLLDATHNVYPIDPDYLRVLEAIANDSRFDRVILEFSDGEQSLSEAIQELIDNSGHGAITFHGQTKSLQEHVSDIFAELDEETLSNIDALAASLGMPDFTIEGGVAWTAAGEAEARYNTYKGVLNNTEFQTLKAKLDGVISGFEKSTDKGKAAYDAAVEYAKTLDFVVNGAEDADVAAKEFVDRMLFNGTDNIVDKVNEVKGIRTNMIHTPIIEWINALSPELDGETVPLWDLLQDEIKGLASKDKLEQYVIENPNIASEIEYLQYALQAAGAALRGMHPMGANLFINQTGEVKLPVIDIPALYDVYSQDLATLINRVWTLSELHKHNKRSTVKLRKETMAVNAPKFFAKILQKTAEEYESDMGFRGKLYELSEGKIKLDDLWNDAFDLSSVTVDNLPEFWKAAREFLNKLYDSVEGLDWDHLIAKYGKSKNEIIADTVTNGFSDLWKLRGSTIDNNADSEVTNSDIVGFLTSMLAVDPRTTFGTMKMIAESGTGVKPFWDQMLAISMGFAKGQNRDLFNAVLNNVYNDLIEKLNSSDPEVADLEEDDRNYLKNKTKMENSLFIDGSSGTGKSTVVLRFIKEMNNLITTDSEGNTIIRKSIATAKYSTRMNALAGILGTSGENAITLDSLYEKLLGRRLAETDFESDDSGHARKLKESTINELRARTNVWGLNENEVLDVYIDESGLLSEGEIGFLVEASKLGAVNLYFAGDIMQNAASVTIGSETASTGQMDCFGFTTPRLNLSMRVGNWGMVNNLDQLESAIRTMLEVWRKKPWIKAEQFKAEVEGIIPEITFKYYEKPDALYGFQITSSPETAINKLKSLPKTEANGKIAIITDHKADYTSYSSADIDVFSPEEVQGGEYDYVLIDVDKFSEDSPLDYYRSVYTMVSRAKTGGYIVDKLGSKFDSAKSDVLASTIVNPQADASGEGNQEMEDYKTWWTRELMATDEWGTAPTEPSTTSTPPTPGTPPPTTPPGTPPAPAPPTPPGSSGSSGPAPTPGSSTAPTVPVVLPTWDAEAYKAEVKAKGADAINAFTTERSKQKREDLEHYKRYHEATAEGGDIDTGTLVDFKSFIDSLFRGDMDFYLFGSTSMPNRWSPVNASLSDDKKLQYRQLIRNFALDIFELDLEQLKSKYAPELGGISSALSKSWVDFDSHNSEWKTFYEDLFKSIGNMRSKIFYAVKDGDFSYLYYTFTDRNGKTFAIPVAKINKGLYEGYVQIEHTQVTPLIMLSSDGHTENNIKAVVGNYAQVGKSGRVLVADPKKLPVVDGETGEQLRRFMNSNKGIPNAVVSATFDDDDSDLFDSDMDGEQVKRVDKTGNKANQSKYISDDTASSEIRSRKRLMRAGRRVNLETYMELASLLNKAHRSDKTLTKEERTKLNSQFQESVITAIETSVDAGDIMKALRKAYLISPTNRANLMSALMRYWNQSSDEAAKTKFFNNFHAWVTSAGYFSKIKGSTDKVYKQKGAVFTVRNKMGLTYEFYIVYNSGTNSYEIKGKLLNTSTSNFEDAVIIESIPATSLWSAGDVNPEKAAQVLLNELKRKGVDDRTFLSFLNDFDEKTSGDFVGDLSGMFKSGYISFGLATFEPAADGKLFYYKPFDSDIAALMNDIKIPDDMEDFLREDSIFKYGFLVGVKANASVNENWMECALDDLTTDIIEVVPPLHQILNAEAVPEDGLPTGLGTLMHRGVTEDPTEVTVRRTFDESGNIVKWELESGFRISKDDLIKLGATGIDSISSTTVVISRAEPGFVYVTDGANTYRIAVPLEGIEAIFNDMNMVDIKPNVISKNGELQIVEDKGNYVVVSGESSTKAVRILNYEGGRLRVMIGGDRSGNETMLEFDVKKEDFEKLRRKWPTISIPVTSTFVGNVETMGKELMMFYDSASNKFWIRFDGTTYSGDSLITYSDDTITIKLNGEVFEIPSTPELLGSLKKLGGEKPAPAKKKANPAEKAKQEFSSANPAIFSDPLLQRSPDSWAARHARELNGIFTWNGSNWTKEKNKQWPYLYALYMEEVYGIPFESDMLPGLDVKVSGNNLMHVLTVTDAEGNTRTFNAKWDIPTKSYILTEINSTSADTGHALIEEINALSDPNIRNAIKEHIACMRGEKSSLSEEAKANLDKVDPNLLYKIDDNIDSLDDSVTCEII